MKISQLNLYPIKSLRPISVQSATICEQGLANDRRYVLLDKGTTGEGKWDNMFIGDQPEMALFHPALSSPKSFTVSYHKPSPPIARETPEQETTIEIPFTPELEGLKKVMLDMHTDPNYPAYIMPDHINAWFSACLGYPAWLAYLGDSLGVPKTDEKAVRWKSSLKLPSEALSSVAFSDSAPLLVVSESSLSNLNPLLAGEKAILEKFRPNIVISDPELEAWDEDYWGELLLDRLNIQIILTANCSRCRSINVDLEKGTKAEGNSGKLLKLMQKDRRVDPGSKYSPIFGRYGFPTSGGEVRVGDEIRVSLRNEERSIWNGIMPRLTKFPTTITTTEL